MSSPARIEIDSSIHGKWCHYHYGATRRDQNGLPNEMRLSCGAGLEGSQTEFYNTECGRVTDALEHGRRQLQALVRLRTTSHSSGPSPAGSTEGHSPSLASRRDSDAEWTVAPNLRIRRRAPHPKGTLLG